MAIDTAKVQWDEPAAPAIDASKVEWDSPAPAAPKSSAVRRVLGDTGAGVTFCSGQDLSIFTGKVKGEEVRKAIVTYYAKTNITGVG